MSMRYGTVAGVDKRASRLVMGTMIVTAQDEPRSFALLDAALEFGWNALDTAHVYGSGNSERGIGRWMAARGKRDEVFVITKGAHLNADRKRVTPFDIAADLHDSLARLKTDYVDLYLLHRDDPDVPVGPIVEALNEHRAAGRIRAFGGSNWTHPRLAEANEYAEKHGLVPFVASSPNFSLAEQLEGPWGPDCITISGPAQADARAWYEQTGMPVFAWSSLGRGFFSGLVRAANPEAAAELISESSVRAYCCEDNFERLRRTETIARERNVTVPQVALAYALAQPFDLFAIVGAANREELEANTAALELDLTPAEVAWLDLRGERP